jgi:hypothetical protein
VVVSDSEVVDGGDFIEVRDRLDGYQHNLAADQLIPTCNSPAGTKRS